MQRKSSDSNRSPHHRGCQSHTHRDITNDEQHAPSNGYTHRRAHTHSQTDRDADQNTAAHPYPEPYRNRHTGPAFHRVGFRQPQPPDG